MGLKTEWVGVALCVVRCRHATRFGRPPSGSRSRRRLHLPMAARRLPSGQVQVALERDNGRCSPSSMGRADDRTFEATAPNRKWIADFTYL